MVQWFRTMYFFALGGVVQSLVGELSFHKTWYGKKISSLLVVLFFYVLLTVTDDDILIISCGGGTMTSLFILVSIYSCC